jgi:virulence-associated protein VapD
VHWDESGQVEIYQFVNRQGTVYLQVPSEQLLKLARQISIELARNATRKGSAAAEGGNDQ